MKLDPSTSQRKPADGLARGNASAESLLEGQNRVLELIAGDAPLGEIFDLLTRLIELQAPELYATVLLVEDGRLRHGAAPHLPRAYNEAIEGVAIGPSAGSCGTAAFTGQRVIVADIATDPLWAAYRHLALPYGLRACWSTPICSASGQVLGTFALYYMTPGEPPASDLHLVDVATHMARIAIERHRTDEALKERARQLAETDRRKDEFLALLAHELRNPLAPILTSLELMRVRAGEPAVIERYRDLVERQVRQLARLVDDLLDVSRLTRGKIQLTRAPTTAMMLIERALEIAQPVIVERGHELDIHVEGAPLLLDVDAVRLAQALSNLFNNAARYTEPGGRIAITAAREGDEVVIRIRDTGVGISPEVLPHVFDLFVQANRALDRSQGGLGIGLTLVRRLVEMHGGRVEAYSDGVGRGSEFVVRLPLGVGGSVGGSVGGDMPGSPAGAVPEPTLPARALRRVLIVDDNIDAAESLAEALAHEGAEVSVAHDGLEALAAVESFHPDVVVLDIGLPGLGGYDVARRLRAEHPASELRLIALTGYGQAADVRRAREAGFDAHLVKPADLDHILAAISA